MTLRTWLLALLSFLVVTACIAPPLIPQTALPFDAVPIKSDKPTLQVLSSSLGLPMPEGLKAGDRMVFEEMSPDTRAFFMVGGLNAPAGTVMNLAVRRDDGLHHVQVTLAPVPFLNGNDVNMAIESCSYALTLLTATLGLLLLWRGRSEATLGLAVWCFGSLIQAFVIFLPLPVPYCQLLSWSGNTLQIMTTLVGMYIVADGLTREVRAAAARRLTHTAFILISGLYLASVVIYNRQIYLTGEILSPWTTVIVGLHFSAFMMSLGVLLFSYRRSDAVSRARMRWVLFSLLGLLLSYVFSQFLTRINISILLLTILVNALYAASLMGFAYAVLRHRLISLQLVLNRALVYGLLTSLVVGMFAALLSLLEHNAINSQTNQFLALLIPLVLGMGINSLKRKVDEYINAAFFRHRHKAEASLAQFARSCGFVEDPDRLLDLAAEQLHRNSRAQGLAIYLTQKGKAGPKLARRQGVLESPAKLGNDDLALLRLKAGDAEVDLRGTFSALAAEGYAYALAVRGELLGFIVVGPRPSEAYTSEERHLYALVAQQVGVALHALRLQDQQKLLQDIAKGAFKSMPKARARAKALMEARAA